ncbi:MAG TPA: carbon storage regulator [Bryobacteraceae bacterium]|nr:carbon storage regulator [Bryobacteraceae bacterium]
MLVVRRRQGESVLIGDDIEIVVLEAGANRVKLGIMAPREILVFRKELELTREQNRVAATADVTALSRLANVLGDLGLRRKPGSGQSV